MTAGQDIWMATVSTVSDRDIMKWCLQPDVDAIEKTRQEVGQLLLQSWADDGDPSSGLGPECNHISPTRPPFRLDRHPDLITVSSLRGF